MRTTKNLAQSLTAVYETVNIQADEAASLINSIKHHPEHSLHQAETNKEAAHSAIVEVLRNSSISKQALSDAENSSLDIDSYIDTAEQICIALDKPLDDTITPPEFWNWCLEKAMTPLEAALYS